MMRDIIPSVVFVACQLLLLAMIGVVLLSRRPGAPQSSKLAARIRTGIFGVAIAAVIVTGLVDITWAALQQERDAARSGNLVGQARHGAPLIVRFDKGACVKWDLGTIACETDYRAHYDPRAERWVVSGYSNGAKDVITAEAADTQGPGSLAVWGALFRFDDAGMVYRSEQPAGTVKLEPQSAKP